MSKKYHSLIATALLVTAALLATGCSNNSLGTEPELMDHQQMVDEYRTSAQSFDWPDSYPAPNEPAGENPEVMFEVGFGNTLASLDYQCSWEKEWLETYSTDPARAEAALQKLEKVPSMDFMSHEVTDDATREIFADYLNRAKLGDPSGFQEDVELNCP